MANQFEHIKPEEVFIIEYPHSNAIYFPSREIYLKSDKDLYGCDYVTPNGLKKYATVGPRGTVNFYKFTELPQTIKDKFRKISPELYKHFEDYYKKPQAPAVDKPKFSENPEDYWFFSRGAGWEVVRRDIYRMAHRGASVICSRWLDGTHDTVKAGDYITHSFQDLIRTNDHKIKTLKEQNPEQFEKYMAYYTTKVEEIETCAIRLDIDLPRWRFYCYGPSYNLCMQTVTSQGIWFTSESKGKIKKREDEHLNAKGNWVEWSKLEAYAKEKLKVNEPELYSRLEELYNKDKELDPSQFIIGMWTPSAYYCILRSSLENNVVTAIPFGSPNNKDNWANLSKASFYKLMEFTEVLKSGEIQRKLREANPSRFKAFEDHYAFQKAKSTNTPMSRWIGSDFDIDKQLPQNVASNRGKSMHDLLGLFQEKPTLEDWATVLNPYNKINSPKQQINNEQFKLPTAPKCITGRKELTGSAVQGTSGKAAIAAEHSLNRGGLSSGRISPRIS